MTNPVTPATDEEVERLREQARDSRSVIASHALMLIARIDAERAALTESEAARDRMRALLDAVAVAVRGPPASNAMHDHARLPDEVAKIKAARDKWEARTVRLADALRTQRKDGLCTTCHEARARAIRAVVAAQWGVALRSMAHRYPVLSRDAADEGCQVMCENIRELAALPTAEQIVDGVF